MLTRSALAVVVGSLVVGSLVMTAACSGSTTSPSLPPPATLTASVSDAIGDTVLSPVLRNGVLVTPVVAVPPDLAGATIEIANGNLTATISFAPGTLSHTNSFACILLDADENPSTGGPSAGGDVPLGYDYSICAVVPRASTTAQVSVLGGGVSTGIGSVPATFPTNDQVRFVVPMSLLGNDDGRMAFKVQSMQWVDDPIFNSGAIDWMPDLGRPAALIR
jgi:hypothetical protein